MPLILTTSPNPRAPHHVGNISTAALWRSIQHQRLVIYELPQRSAIAQLLSKAEVEEQEAPQY